MTPSCEFWKLELERYNLERPLSLRMDRIRSSIDQRSGFASLAEFVFDDDIATAFLNYASSHQVTPFQLGLATFYAFLFKLTHGHCDLCTTCIDANRYRTELQDIVGIFLAILPYRIELDPHWSFDELVKHVREKCLSILEHSHYPLQRILSDSHRNQSNISFLQTAFDFITISSSINHLSINDTSLEMISSKPFYICTKYDFMLILYYNSTLSSGKLFCRLLCSRDLFDDTTVAKISRRLEHLVEQIFSPYQTDRHLPMISEFDIILPNEIKEMEDAIFCRLSNIVNEGMY
jgi:non-ribosomal peptide synthetase component F